MKVSNFGSVETGEDSTNFGQEKCNIYSFTVLVYVIIVSL